MASVQLKLLKDDFKRLQKENEKLKKQKIKTEAKKKIYDDMKKNEEEYEKAKEEFDNLNERYLYLNNQITKDIPNIQSHRKQSLVHFNKVIKKQEIFNNRYTEEYVSELNSGLAYNKKKLDEVWDCYNQLVDYMNKNNIRVRE